MAPWHVGDHGHHGGWLGCDPDHGCQRPPGRHQHLIPAVRHRKPVAGGHCTLGLSGYSFQKYTGQILVDRGRAPGVRHGGHRGVRVRRRVVSFIVVTRKHHCCNDGGNEQHHGGQQQGRSGAALFGAELNHGFLAAAGAALTGMAGGVAAGLAGTLAVFSAMGRSCNASW